MDRKRGGQRKSSKIEEKSKRERDIPYMTVEWKRAISNTRKYAVRTAENLELKKKYGNIAKAITAYWHKKSEELKSGPTEFFKGFRPFISTKRKTLMRYAYSRMEAQ